MECGAQQCFLFLNKQAHQALSTFLNRSVLGTIMNTSASAATRLGACAQRSVQAPSGIGDVAGYRQALANG